MCLIKQQGQILRKFINMLKILLKERKKAGIKKLKNPKAFIDYLQTIDDVY